MTQISRNPLGKETNQEIQATLWWLLARLNNDIDIKKFLKNAELIITLLNQGLLIIHILYFILNLRNFCFKACLIRNILS